MVAHVTYHAPIYSLNYFRVNAGQRDHRGHGRARLTGLAREAKVATEIAVRRHLPSEALSRSTCSEHHFHGTIHTSTRALSNRPASRSASLIASSEIIPAISTLPTWPSTEPSSAAPAARLSQG